MENLIKELKKLGIKDVKIDEPLFTYTSLKVGGNAKFMIFPKTVNQLCKTIKFLKQNNVKFVLLGNCTNVLISDSGINDVVIKIGKPLNNFKANGNELEVEAGMSLFELNRLCANLRLSGLEWSFGIPGSVGGAIKMNSGAFGHCMAEFVKSVLVFDGEKKKWLKNKDMNFDYRNSIICKTELIVLKVKFELKFLEKEKIIEEQNLAFEKKKSTQPYAEFSAGSVFKRQNGLAVSKIIDDLGLKGFKIGGAEVSKIHAGFIVNKGQASCKDILKLIEYIREKINQEYGFVPELEIQILGDTNDFIRGLSHPHNI